MNAIQTSQDTARAYHEIDMREVFLTLRRHKRRIAICTAAAMVLAVGYVLSSVPQFTVNGTMYLGDARRAAPTTQAEAESGLSYLSDYQAISDINTQVELMSSDALVEQAVLESGLNAPVRRADAPPLRFWRWVLLHGHNVRAFAPAPGDLQAADVVIDTAPRGAVTFDITIGKDGTFVVTRRQGWFAAPVTVLSGMLGQPAAGGGLNMMLKPAVDGAIPAQGSHFVMQVTAADAVRDALKNGGLLDVTAGGQVSDPTKIASLTYTGANPYSGQKFINALMNDFISSQVSWNSQAASATQDFISKQLEGIKTSLVTADRKLAAFQSQTGILDVPENAKAVIDQLSQYEMQRTTIQLQQQALQQLETEIDHPAGTLNPYLLSQTNDSVLGQLATSLAQEQVKLAALQAQFNNNAPDVVVEQAAVTRLQQAIHNIIGNELAMANRSLANIDAAIATFDSQLKAMPAESLQVIALTRASDVFGQMYVLLMQKEEEAAVTKVATINDTRIVTPPQVPRQQSAPRGAVVLALGLCLGLFGSVAATLLQRSISGRFQSEEEIRRLVRLPVYGVIPLRAVDIKDSALPAPPHTPFAGAIRSLRGNIIRSGAPQRSRVILLTSPGIDDGKTTIATNLAKALTDTGKSVILVDADLHRGRLSETLKMKTTAGLTEWLVAMEKPPLPVVPGQRFSLLPTGVLPPNPSELINETYLLNILAALRAEYDYVVIDSPPLPAVPDGVVLGEMADLILSVVSVENSRRKVMAAHVETLSTVDRRHGIVINSVTENAYGYGYGRGSESAVLKLRRIVERV